MNETVNFSQISLITEASLDHARDIENQQPAQNGSTSDPVARYRGVLSKTDTVNNGVLSEIDSVDYGVLSKTDPLPWCPKLTRSYERWCIYRV